MRLTAAQWLWTAAIVLACAWGIPRLWKRLEPFDTPADYRLPYALNEDYWLYQRRLENIPTPLGIPVLGDSVIWGEYVRPNGTLTHFLNQAPGQAERFVNCGVNGLFPLAMEGLVRHYGSELHGRQLVMHCNLLWLTSPKADLSTTKEESFNHSRLVPQFFPSVPCYRADASQRLGAVVGRSVGLLGWVDHVEHAYFDRWSIPQWTLQENPSGLPRYANAWRNPLRQIARTVPVEPQPDPQRGPESERHKPWNAGGSTPTRFAWVDVNASLQWQALQRTIAWLRDHGSDILVLVGPFNEHMVVADQQPAYREIRDRIAAWLAAQQVPCVLPEILPSDLYADASHPLTDGYALLAQRISQDAIFRQWLTK